MCRAGFARTFSAREQRERSGLSGLWYVAHLAQKSSARGQCMRAGIAREWLREVRSISYAEQDLLARGAGNCLREVRVLGLARGQREVRSILYGMQSRDQ